MSRPIPPVAASAEARFWKKVERRGPDECWEWLGLKKGRGYGILSIGGRHVRATRILWSMQHGVPFPDGKIACHTCDNPGCVNPAHIWAGTQSDNMQDMMAKRRNGGRSLPRTVCKRGHSPSDLVSDRHRSSRRCVACGREDARARTARNAKQRLGGNQ